MLISQSLFAQEHIDVNSELKEVTVYTSGALVTREANFKGNKGKEILRLTNLSPYIREESIKIEGDGSFTILNVQFKNDYLNSLERDQRIQSMIDSLVYFKNKIEESGTQSKILVEQLGFLKANQNISGKQEAIDLASLKALNNYYKEQLQSLNMEILKQKRLKTEYEDEKKRITNQLNSIRNNRELPSGTIDITIESNASISSKLGISYRVNKANWYPSYDIRFTGTKDPVQIAYKANITQNTGIDWKDVNIVLSNAQSHISGQIPSLDPWRLYFYFPELTSAMQGRVAGVALEDDVLDRPVA